MIKMILDKQLHLDFLIYYLHVLYFGYLWKSNLIDIKLVGKTIDNSIYLYEVNGFGWIALGINYNIFGIT